jgi:hypothetical protein
MKMDTGHLGSFLIIAISWLPVLNSFATLVLLPPYWKLVVRFLTTGRFSVDKKIHALPVNTSKDPVKKYRPWGRYKEQSYVVEKSYASGSSI